MQAYDNEKGVESSPTPSCAIGPGARMHLCRVIHKPADGRYGETQNRLYQCSTNPVVMKPSIKHPSHL